MLLKIVLMLLLVGGSAVASSGKDSFEIPNDIMALLSNHVIPKGLFQKLKTPKVKMPDYDVTRSFNLDSIIKLLKPILIQKESPPKATFELNSFMKQRKVNPTQNVEALDDVVINPLQLDSLLKLRSALYQAYMAYRMNNPIDLLFSRKEHDFGSRTKKESVNLIQDDGSKTDFLHYLLPVTESPTSSPDTAYHQMLKQSMRNSSIGEQKNKKNSNQQKRSQIISVSRAPLKLKSTTMDKNKNVFHKEMFVSRIPGMKASRSFDDLQTLPSFKIEAKVQAPDPMAAPLEMKPKARGYQQIWKKGQGLVVDREYDLLSSNDYRSHPKDSKNDKNEQSLYVHNTDQTIRFLDMLSRESKKIYQTQKKKSSNVKQQVNGFDGGKEPQYMVPPKPKAEFIQVPLKRDYTYS